METTKYKSRYKYQRARPFIGTGDHLGWKSSGIVGRFIRLKIGDTINHSSMAIKLRYPNLENRRFEMGALNRGMEFHMLSRRLEKYRGEVYWYPLKDEYNELRAQIAAKAFDIIDIKYDYESLFKNVLGRVSTEVSKFFCSEAYNWILNKVGIDTGFPLGEKAPTPADIDKFPIFKDKVRIL